MTEAQLWGFVQLVGLIFITSNCREIVANCLKYGWVVHWIPKTVINVQNHIALVVGTGMVVVLALISFWVEVRRGDQFCSSWAPAIKELQHIEYELQMRSKKHNIFNLHRELKGHYGRLSASGSVATDGPSGGNGPSVEGNSMVTPGILTALASDSERVNTPKTSDIKTAGDNSDATRMDAAGLDANTPEGVRDALECSRDLDLPPDRGRDAQKPQSVKIEETVKIQESMAVIAAPTGSATGALGKVARDRKKTADSDMTTVGGDLTGGSELKLSPVSGLRQRGRPGISDKQSVSPNINLDNAQSESSDDSIREAGRKRPAGGYRKRYIDPTRNFDISNVLSVAENYMRSQQKRINSIKNEVGDLMMKSPLVAVYNRLSMRVTERHVEFVHSIKAFVLCSLIFGVPYAIVLSTAFDPLSSLFLLMLSCTWMLKMISFHHTLHDLRLIILSDTTSLTDIIPFDDERASYLHYPYSLSLKHFVVYLIAPTLCFQFNYPRRKDRDWQKIGKAALQLAFSLILLKIIYEQYVTKVLENTFTLRYGGEDGMKMVLHMVERLMKLSIPTLYCWLLMFLSFFHYWMMFLAEITRFEDQQFYREWWNATSLEEYWRRWNLPVHHFCIRHVYIPLISHGWSRTVANQTVFLLSALAHEYIVAGSLKLGWTGLVFLAFVMQTPLSILTSSKYIQARPKLGNSIFWIVFCFTGQPMGVLIFYYLWNVKAGLLQPIDTTQVFKPAPPF